MSPFKRSLVAAQSKLFSRNLTRRWRWSTPTSLNMELITAEGQNNSGTQSRSIMIMALGWGHMRLQLRLTWRPSKRRIYSHTSCHMNLKAVSSGQALICDGDYGRSSICIEYQVLRSDYLIGLNY